MGLTCDDQADRFLSAMQAAGAPVETLDSGDIRRAYPALRASNGTGPPADLEGLDRQPIDSMLASLAQWVADRFVTADGPVREPQGCIYTWLPDEAFELVARDRVVAVSACSGRGFKFGVLSGDRAAEAAASRV